MNTYLAKVQQYGKPAPGAKTLEYSGFAGPMFGNVLTAVKFINELGVDQATVKALDGKIRAFKGPMMLQVGAAQVQRAAVRVGLRRRDGNPAVQGWQVGQHRRRPQRQADRRLNRRLIGSL